MPPTQMTTLEFRLHSFVMYASVLLSLFLVAILWFKLEVTPSQVKANVEILHGDMERVNARLKQQIDEMQTVLDERGVWIESVDSELAERTRDRMYRADFVKWQNELRTLNPGLEVPKYAEKPNQ